MTDDNEYAKAFLDSCKYGTGIMKDGKYVPSKGLYDVAPSGEFDPSEYRVERRGKRSTDEILICYEPKGSPLGTQKQVPKWLADAFEHMLKDYASGAEGKV